VRQDAGKDENDKSDGRGHRGVKEKGDKGKTSGAIVGHHGVSGRANIEGGYQRIVFLRSAIPGER
jgi:hypothetical protein